MQSLMDSISNEEFIEIVNNSISYSECLLKIGYKANSGNLSNKLKEKINSLNLDTSHFTNQSKEPVKRNPENIFIENSTANQSTLRKYYKKGNYTPYKCSICGMEPFWQGKELTLILDHINGQNHDDRLENLRWVCPNCNQQLETTGSKNINFKETWKAKVKEKNKYFCPDCGKEVSKKGCRCLSCATKINNFKMRKVKDRPSREQLKEEIRTNSFCSIGKKYGVSDNTIRKWCKSYNLPSSKITVDLYSDSQWEKI